MIDKAGKARHGVLWHGAAGLGVTRRGMARRGRQGKSRHVKAWHGTAGRDEARQGRHGEDYEKEVFSWFLITNGKGTWQSLPKR